MKTKKGRKKILGDAPMILKFRVNKEVYERLIEIGKPLLRSAPAVAREILLTAITKKEILKSWPKPERA